MRYRRGKTLIRGLIGLVVLLALVGAGYWLYSRVLVPTAQVTTVVVAPVVQAFYATGTLQPVREHPIRSNVEGPLTQMMVDKGDTVKAGQKVGFVFVEEANLRHRQALADLELAQKRADADNSPIFREFDKRITATQEQLDIAKRDYERVKALRDSRDASESDFDRAAERVQVFWKELESLHAQKAARQLELERDLAVAKAALDIAQWKLDEQNIISPVEGVVLNRPTPLGTRVRLNDDLMIVADVRPQSLRMRAQIDEEDKTRTFLNQPVRSTLYAYPGRIFNGRVIQIYPQADADRRTFEIDLQLEPVDERFAAGMTGELAFIVDEKAVALVVPSQAVRMNQQGQPEVWVIDDHGRIARQTVQLGLRSVERSEVASGLREGQTVVINPLDPGRIGRRVRLENVAPDVAAGLNTKPEEKPSGGFN